MKTPHYYGESVHIVPFEDNRRSTDRRQFSYSTHIPERRKSNSQHRLSQMGGYGAGVGEPMRQGPVRAG